MSEKIEVMVCSECGAIWIPQVWRSIGRCQACKNPDGKLEQRTPDELSH